MNIQGKVDQRNASCHKTMQYRPYIDGLRALAVVSVIVFHGYPTVLTGGFVGVDIFFVLSGFLITYLISKEMENATFSFTRFYTRRIRRLLPAGLTVYATTIVAAAFILAPPEFEQLGESLIAAALVYANFFFAQRTGYFDTPAGEQPLLHTWSLAVEEQFYILWPPLLLLLMLRLNSNWRVALILALLATSLVYGDVMARLDPSKTFFSFAARAWELLLGASLALVIDRIRLQQWTANFIAVLGVFGITASIVLLNETSVFPGFSALPACLGTGMVIASSYHRQTLISKLLSTPPLVYTGLISYSLYLWHWPILSLGRIYLQRPLNLMETTGLIALVILLSVLSLKFIEKPFRFGHGSMIFTQKRTIFGGVLAITMIALTGVAMKAGDGWPWRLDTVSQAIYKQINTKNPRRSRCYGTEKIFVDDAFCNIGAPKPASASFDFAIIGDSNADHFVPTFAAEAKRRGLSGRQVTQSTCAGLIGVSVHTSQKRKKKCRDYQQQILRFIETNPGLKLAILSGNWATYQRTLGENDLARMLPRDIENTGNRLQRTNLEDHLLAMIRYLQNAGIKVHLIGQVPHQDIAVRCVVNSLRAGGDAQKCGITTEVARTHLKKSTALFRSIAARYDDVTVTIPGDILCNAERCPLYRDRVFLYHDFGHLNAIGAASLADQFPLPAFE